MSANKQRKYGKRRRPEKRLRVGGKFNTENYSSPRTANLGTGGTPAKVRMTLKYSSSIALSTTTTTNYAFRANGPYDPDYTGTGGQPYNYDDWALLYNRYRVHGSTIKWNWAQGVNAFARLACTPINAVALFTTMDDQISAPLTKYVATWATFGDGGKGMSGVRQRATTSQILGEVSGDRFQSQVAAVPADPWYWYFKLESSDGATTASGRLTLVIEYDVEFFDRLPETLDVVESKILALTRKARIMKTASQAGLKQSGERKFPLGVEQELPTRNGFTGTGPPGPGISIDCQTNSESDYIVVPGSVGARAFDRSARTVGGPPTASRCQR